LEFVKILIFITVDMIYSNTLPKK